PRPRGTLAVRLLRGAREAPRGEEARAPSRVPRGPAAPARARGARPRWRGPDARARARGDGARSSPRLRAPGQPALREREWHVRTLDAAAAAHSRARRDRPALLSWQGRQAADARDRGPGRVTRDSLAPARAGARRVSVSRRENAASEVCAGRSPGRTSERE